MEPDWLPPGSHADVVRAGPHDSVPEPVGLVRLLVVHDQSVLVVPRRQGNGVDLPTARSEGDWNAALRELTDAVGASPSTARLLGWVHNHVPSPDDGYEWPVPDATSVAFRSEVTERPASGRWLAPSTAVAELGSRHWWPLLGS